MKKKVIIGSVVVLVFIILSQRVVINMLLNLTLAGAIPGTHYIIPYWLMMAIYCLIITVIVTIYTERLLRKRREHKSAALRRSRTPSRHYSHI